MLQLVVTEEQFNTVHIILVQQCIQLYNHTYTFPVYYIFEQNLNISVYSAMNNLTEKLR